MNWPARVAIHLVSPSPDRPSGLIGGRRLDRTVRVRGKYSCFALLSRPLELIWSRFPGGGAGR